MENLIIYGGNSLHGKIDVDCAKNALLPILAACILCDDKIVLKNVTYYLDIINMLDILSHLGAKISSQKEYLEIDCSSINKFDVPIEQASKLRASIFLLGPLLSKFKKARVAYPGGCAIGARPIDLHILGLQKLGVKIVDRHGIISASAENLYKANIYLPFPSVGATENIIMTSVLINGETKLFGCAKEPEVVDLCNFLNKMGAKIFGAGTDEIVICGVKKLRGCEYSPVSDRIVAGTYLMAPLICGGEVEICNVEPMHIKPILDLVENNSCKIYVNSDKIYISCNSRPNGFGKIETMPYPFFPTDLQQPITALASIANGNTILVENMFENRFNHIKELIKMGAKITVKDRTALIEGQKCIFGANVNAPDLRGGACLVLAGLVANGYTTISNIEYIDRGYFEIDKKLNKLGAKIIRTKI